MCWERNSIGYRELSNCSERPVTGSTKSPGTGRVVPMTVTPRPGFDQWLLAQTYREDPVGDIAREFSEDRSVGCAGDIRTSEQLIGHIERVPHAIDLSIRAVEQARAEYLRGRVDPLRARADVC